MCVCLSLALSEGGAARFMLRCPACKRGRGRGDRGAAASRSLSRSTRNSVSLPLRRRPPVAASRDHRAVQRGDGCVHPCPSPRLTSVPLPSDLTLPPRCFHAALCFQLPLSRIVLASAVQRTCCERDRGRTHTHTRAHTDSVSGTPTLFSSARPRQVSYVRPPSLWQAALRI